MILQVVPDRDAHSHYTTFPKRNALFNYTTTSNKATLTYLHIAVQNGSS